MPSARETLTKVLALEGRKGYTDEAVIGGLAAFVPRWAEAARAELDDSLVTEVVAALDGYRALPAERRAQQVAAALAAVERVTSRAAAGGATTVRGAKDATTGRPAASVRAAAESAPPPASTWPLRTDDDPALDAPVTALKGIGPRLAGGLQRLEIRTIRDLILHLPHRYNDYRQLQPIHQLQVGQETTILGTVWDVRRRKPGPGRQVLTVVLADRSGTVPCTFFNQPYLERRFPQGARIVVSGRPVLYKGRLTFNSPEWEPYEGELVHTGRLVPVYPLTEGIRQRWLRARIREAITARAGQLGDPLPPELRAHLGLPTVPDAVRALHVPTDEAEVALAQRRLAFDDLLVLGLWSRQRRRQRKATPAPDLSAGAAARRALVGTLPFELTGAQQRCLDEIGSDLASGELMTRLLQGDVGSGKTAVAAGAVVQCVAAGWQAALMAPTEILAEQHFASLSRLLEPLGYWAFDPAGEPVTGPGPGPGIARLVGSMKPAAKAAVSQALRQGDLAVVVGTHALIQEHVRFPRLGLAVVDEQHRFGVLQRGELALRGQTEGVADPASLTPHTEASPIRPA